jgi:hypothetical protein
VALFGSPEEHAQNPPSSWVVVKLPRNGRASRWALTTASEAESFTVAPLETFATRRDAEGAKSRGFLFDLWHKDARWYAGEDVGRWKTYAECRVM